MNSFEYNFLGLSKSYESRWVVRDVRIKVLASRCTVLVGKNGAGKTTLLKIISGLEKPDAGLIRIDGESYQWSRCKNQLLSNILYQHQQPYMFEGSVRRNLQFTQKVSKQSEKTIDDAIAWANLENIIDQNAKNLSGGEQQRVSLARAYLRSPNVILFDEPTANLDHQSRLKTLELLGQFKQEGIAIIIASHDPEMFKSIQDECLQLNDGKLTNLKPRNKSSRVTELHPYKANSA